MKRELLEFSLREVLVGMRQLLSEVRLLADRSEAAAGDSPGTFFGCFLFAGPVVGVVVSARVMSRAWWRALHARAASSP